MGTINGVEVSRETMKRGRTWTSPMVSIDPSNRPTPSLPGRGGSVGLLPFRPYPRT
ncbi:hypothetical protein NJ7G_3414 [Natrinema sp. J7-2]|nr:hypothetical protein NJ7G_3414 [Natrinema sp. J7-2]